MKEIDTEITSMIDDVNKIIRHVSIMNNDELIESTLTKELKEYRDFANNVKFLIYVEVIRWACKNGVYDQLDDLCENIEMVTTERVFECPLGVFKEIKNGRKWS